MFSISFKFNAWVYLAYLLGPWQFSFTSYENSYRVISRKG